MIEPMNIHIGDREVDVTEVFLQGLRLGYHSGKVDDAAMVKVAKLLSLTTDQLLEVIDGTRNL